MRHRRLSSRGASAGWSVDLSCGNPLKGALSMLLHNAWYIAAWADELGTQPVARRICNEPIVLFRDNQHRAAALTDRCCHRAAPLHLGYLNAKTVGGNPSAHVSAEMKTTRTPTGLKFTRWMKNSVPPPSYVKAAGFQGRVDRCQIFEFVAPSTVLQWTGAADAGSDYADPQRDFRFQFRLFHGLTPETETSCYYFWSVANGYRQNEPEATEQLYREIAPTFIEDKDMVEAQQRRLDEFGERGLVDIASDANRMHMRRMVERLIAQEPPALAAE